MYLDILESKICSAVSYIKEKCICCNFKAKFTVTTARIIITTTVITKAISVIPLLSSFLLFPFFRFYKILSLKLSPVPSCCISNISNIVAAISAYVCLVPILIFCFICFPYISNGIYSLE